MARRKRESGNLIDTIFPNLCERVRLSAEVTASHNTRCITAACYVPVARAPVIAQFYLNNFHESMAHCRGWNAAGRLRQRNPVPSISLLIKDTSVQPRTRAFISPECYTRPRYEEHDRVHATCITSSLAQPSHCWCWWLFTWVRS